MLHDPHASRQAPRPWKSPPSIAKASFACTVTPGIWRRAHDDRSQTTMPHLPMLNFEMRGFDLLTLYRLYRKKTADLLGCVMKSMQKADIRALRAPSLRTFTKKRERTGIRRFQVFANCTSSAVSNRICMAAGRLCSQEDNKACQTTPAKASASWSRSALGQVHMGRISLKHHDCRLRKHLLGGKENFPSRPLQLNMPE